MSTKAVVLVKAQTDQISALAQSIANIAGVSDVYSVAGQYDLVAIVEVRDNEQLAEVVSDRIRKLHGIVDTTTLIAFRVYTPQMLEAAFDMRGAFNDVTLTLLRGTNPADVISSLDRLRSGPVLLHGVVFAILLVASGLIPAGAVSAG